jgi:hypothetical protein
MKKLPIGISDFKKLIEGDYIYVFHITQAYSLRYRQNRIYTRIDKKWRIYIFK